MDYIYMYYVIFLRLSLRDMVLKITICDIFAFIPQYKYICNHGM